MADKNKNSKYKDIRYLGLLIAIVTIIVTVIAWIWPIPPPPPSDFGISIDPMLGAIQSGGVILTTVSVMGISGYDHTVSLSSTGQPSGIVTAFVPPFGEAKPSYTSSVTINVNQNVPAGDYTIIIKGTGSDGKEHTCSYILTVKPNVTPTPTHTETPPSPTTNIIDTMDNTLGWETGKDDVGSSINIKSVPGRTGDAIEISYDLKEEGYVTIYKEIDPEILSGKEGIKFYYKSSGEPNTIQLGLRYADVYGTIFGFSSDRIAVTDDWVSIEVPYTNFDCWWPDDNCQYYGDKLDLKNVRKIGFGIQNCPKEGDVYGSGCVIIDDVQGIVS